MKRDRPRSFGQLNADLAEAKIDAALAAYLGSKAPELVTGRATLYHGTSPGRANDIREKGFSPGAKPGATTGLPPEKVGPPAVYFTRNPTMAKMYGKQTAALHNAMARGYIDEGAFGSKRAVDEWIAASADERADATARARGKVLKARVPTWKFPTIDNPEIGNAGAIEQQLREAMGPRAQAPHNSIVSQILDRWLGRQVRQELKSNVVIPDHVGPEYVVDSPHFQKLTAGEVGQYARARPGRFGRGVASAVAVPLLAYDAIQALRGKGTLAKLGGRDE